VQGFAAAPRTQTSAEKWQVARRMMWCKRRVCEDPEARVGTRPPGIQPMSVARVQTAKNIMTQATDRIADPLGVPRAPDLGPQCTVRVAYPCPSRLSPSAGCFWDAPVRGSSTRVLRAGWHRVAIVDGHCAPRCG
jgi:hypothetical protein